MENVIRSTSPFIQTSLDGLSVFTLIALAVVIGLVGFACALFRKRFDVADVAWGIGIVVLAWVIGVMVNLVYTHVLIVLVLISVWGLRLSIHIGIRFFKNKQEDPRYAAWRREWRYPNLRAYFQIFLLQPILMLVLLTPLIAYTWEPSCFHMECREAINWWQAGFGLAVWVSGFVFEIVGDWQLKRFIKNPGVYGLERGDLMTKGLWSLTRHPNYFGEMTMWWGIFIILLPPGNPALISVSALGPIMISCILYFVSGVPMTEKNWSEQFGDKFEQYKKKTPPLFPRLWW